MQLDSGLFTRRHPAALGLILACLFLPTAGTASPPPPSEESNMTETSSTTHHQAKGPFQVQLAPNAVEHGAQTAGVHMALLDKTFEGDLTGSSVGMMLSHRTATDGSAGYVAMEVVTGTLAGHSGSFVLQHSSTMARGVPTQSITVVPDSGTGELTGLSGSMVIEIEDGKHGYIFDYQLE